MLKALAQPKTVSVTLRMTAEQKQAIQAKADAHAGGNFTAWTVYASLGYEPGQDEVAPSEPDPCPMHNERTCFCG